MSVYKAENGKWYCRGQVNGERYNRICPGATNRNEAKEIDASIRLYITRRQRGLIDDTKSYTFSFLMNRYVEISKTNNRSWKNAVTCAKYLILYFGKNKDISTIKRYDIEKFKSYMSSKGRTNATVNRYISALKRAYNILKEDGLINYNPTDNVKRLTEDNRRYRHLTKLEWKRLKLAMPEYLLKIVLVALLTGLRRSNVLKLRWEQIDIQMKIIEIPRQYSKNKKIMRIPMSEPLLDLLMSLSPKAEGYVFVNPKTNKPYTDIKKSFNTALHKAGIEGFWFHDLRRTFGTWLMQSGVDLRTIQELYHHSDISTTERYLAVEPVRKIEAVNNIGDFIE